MTSTVGYPEDHVCNFVEALCQLRDPRDNRGKRHELAFVVAAVVLAMLSGRSKVSSIFRYMRNRLEWLRQVTQHPDACVISRAHLPRLLARLDWTEINTLIEAYFGVRLELHRNGDWVAIDGKRLRGTQGSGDKHSVVFALSHGSRTLLSQALMEGSKTSEIPVVRDLLKASGLERGKVTLDAHHCHPTTTAQIHQAHGRYVIQVKSNQPILLKPCQSLAATATPLSTLIESDKGHGRLTTRESQCFDMSEPSLATRWRESGIETLVVMKRETWSPAKQKTTHETAYYISNQEVAGDSPGQAQDLMKAIRQHWHVESDNWIRDVTFNEDHVKTTGANQGQVMGCLRSLAIRLLRRHNVSNFQEALEDFTDCPSKFEAFLRRVKFL